MHRKSKLRRKSKLYLGKGIKVILARREKCVKFIKFENMDKKEPEIGHYPKYEINIKFTENSTDEEQEQFLDKWFPERDRFNDNLEIFVLYK